MSVRYRSPRRRQAVCGDCKYGMLPDFGPERALTAKAPSPTPPPHHEVSTASSKAVMKVAYEKGKSVGSRGAIVMGFFGAVFLSLTLAWQWRVSGAGLLLPFLVFALIGAAALRVIRRGNRGSALSSRARKTVMWASTAEGIGIFVAVYLVTNLHRPEWRLPAMALIVGLHFLPIAQAAATRTFYILGAALIAIALAGFMIPAPFGSALAGVAAAGCLWVASLAAIRRDGRTAPAIASPA